MNRIEQIVGRAVRNFSHKDLPFEKRNVEIYMHSTLLENNREESADLYVYRVAEFKAKQIGQVSRILKETAVDCILNYEQVNFTQEKIRQVLSKSGEKIKQVLSSGKIIDDFKVGDPPYSANCDYMETCDYNCIPDVKIKDLKIREDTYNENFIVLNSEKILQKIRGLMKERFFYKKRNLIQHINTPKPYPIVQIYAALTQLIEERNEFITDMYGRSGHLINVGDYYLFQPSELNDSKISLLERTTPIDYKNNRIRLTIGSSERRADETKEPEDVPQERIEEPAILKEIRANYELALSFYGSGRDIPRGDDDWYKHTGIVMNNIEKEYSIPHNDLLTFLVEHIFDMMLYEEKVELLHYLYNEHFVIQEEISFESLLKRYIESKIVRTNSIIAIILYSIDKRKMMILKNKWIDAQPEDERKISEEVSRKFSVKKEDFNNIVGFIGYEQKNRYLVFKTRDMLAKRNTGNRCDEAAKIKKIQLLNEIIGQEKYNKENTKKFVQSHLCSLQELLLRHYNKIKKNGKIWFLDPELAKLYKF